MKQKIITLTIALMAIAIGAEDVHAAPTKNLAVTVKSGINLFDDENEDIYMAIASLHYFGQIYMDYSGKTKLFLYVLTRNNRTLFSLDYDGYIAVSPFAQDISYTITDADRKALKAEDPESYEYLASYKTIQVHFIKPPLPGDLDGDGRITVDDITLLISAYLDEDSNPRADVDEDGRITVDDITLLIDYYLNDGD